MKKSAVKFSETATSPTKLAGTKYIAGTVVEINIIMVLKRSNRGTFSRFIVWILFVSAGAVVIFNMVFVLQTATELAILKHTGQEKTAFPSGIIEKRTQDEIPAQPTAQGKVFNLLFIYIFLK